MISRDGGLAWARVPTIRADAVKKLVESVVRYQEHAADILAEMRALATTGSEEIRQSVEDGKRRLTRLAEQGNALALDV